MSDFCIICECEPIDKIGWFISADERQFAVCPWCVENLHNLRKFFQSENVMTKQEFKKIIGPTPGEPSRGS